jgi:hypothetical protein
VGVIKDVLGFGFGFMLDGLGRGIKKQGLVLDSVLSESIHSGIGLS